MIIILRILVLIILIAMVYGFLKYWINPNRKLAKALDNKQTLIIDDPNSIRKNLLVAYKGVLFEGEKYMGTTKEAFEITKIHLWPRDKQKLVGLEKGDFTEIEKKIQSIYPHADITWSSPVRELLKNE